MSGEGLCDDVPYDPLPRLRRDARALAAANRGQMGVEPDDLVSAGWLSFTHETAKGVSIIGAHHRARFAMLDEIGVICNYQYEVPKYRRGPLMHVRIDREAKQLFAAQDRAAVRETRTRLPTRVRRALRALSPRHREALRLWLVEGYDHPLIAEWLATKQGNSGRLRHEALRFLRDRLKVGARAACRAA